MGTMCIDQQLYLVIVFKIHCKGIFDWHSMGTMCIDQQLYLVIVFKIHCKGIFDWHNTWG
jgi:hypothetical protein